MSVAVEDLKSAAGGLTVAERADLAHFLLTSIGPDGSEANDDWQATLTGRVEDIRAGRARGRPVDDVMAELRSQYP